MKLKKNNKKKNSKFFNPIHLNSTEMGEDFYLQNLKMKPNPIDYCYMKNIYIMIFPIRFQSNSWKVHRYLYVAAFQKSCLF